MKTLSLGYLFGTKTARASQEYFTFGSPFISRHSDSLFTVFVVVQTNILLIYPVYRGKADPVRQVGFLRSLSM